MRRQTLQGILLGSLGIFLLLKLWDGSLSWYIHQRFFLLTFLAALGLLLLAQQQFASTLQTPLEIEHLPPQDWLTPRRAAALGLVALPVLLGLLAPAQPLGSAALQNRGINPRAPQAPSGRVIESLLQTPPQDRTLLDWLDLYAYLPNPAAINGQTATLSGFVYKDPALPAHQFYLARFVVTCCTADAYAVGILVESPQTPNLRNDDWLQITGKIQVTAQQLHLIAEKIDPIGAPPQPYLLR
ncbi:MAG: hypothetical protein OHK0052_12860 [Anaerolineales bacterium]